LSASDLGWIKTHRSLLHEPRFTDGDWLKVWMYLWLNATHKRIDTIFKGRRITLEPGQLVTSRRSIADRTKVKESKVERILGWMKSEQQVDWIGGNKSPADYPLILGNFSGTAGEGIRKDEQQTNTG
jgi:hypothetical protein